MKPNPKDRQDETQDEEVFRSVVGQLSYLVDELSAQQPLFSTISDSILSERPINDGKSIKDHYRQILTREIAVNKVIVEGLVSGDLRGRPVDDLLLHGQAVGAEHELVTEIQGEISKNRQVVVKLLHDAPASVWRDFVIENGRRRTLLEWAFRMALDDADSLREISTMLSEIQLIFRR